MNVCEVCTDCNRETMARNAVGVPYSDLEYWKAQTRSQICGNHILRKSRRAQTQIVSTELFFLTLWQLYASTAKEGITWEDCSMQFDATYCHCSDVRSSIENLVPSPLRRRGWAFVLCLNEVGANDMEAEQRTRELTFGRYHPRLWPLRTEVKSYK